MANEARNRLRSMGGIMASSPELLQAQQGYQDGGNVSPTVPVVGGPDRAMRMQQMLSPTPTLSDPRVQESDPRVQESEQFRQGFFGAIGDAFDPFLNPDRGLSDIVGFSQRAAGVPLDALGGLASIAGLDSAAAGLENASDYYYNVGRANIRDGLSTSLGMDSETLSLEPEEFGPVLEQARQDAAAEEDAQTRTRAQQELQQAMPGGMRIGEEDPKRVADTKMEESKSDRAEAQRRLQQTRPEELLTMGGKLASEEELAPPPDPDDNTPKAKRTLRERYEKRMELFKDIFGESDEARARDRAMSLAMMGLAIASGQSPNALTNIAQGAAAGLQSMSEQEQARREQERGLKTLAFETALEDMTAEEEARQEALKRRQDAALDLELARIDSGSGYGSRTDPATAYARFLGDLGKLASDPTSELYGANQSAIERSAYERLRTTYGDIPYVTELGQRLGVSPTNPVMSPEEAEAEANRLLE